ncbi:hypothetical protein sos41_01980 [Alphaproteobacteria bacterium SO-S41]|nr:hypothetical protein sos41_01980 [Alphaproteobacteria bacterium SO-S41]
MNRLLFAALMMSGAAFAQDATPPPAVDQAALAPILAHAWSPGGTCAGEDVMDWVVDKDGWPYTRAQGFTPLTQLEFADGMLHTIDQVGIGSTSSAYKLGDDGTLRLWSEIFDEGEAQDGAGAPTQRVRDGHIVIDDAGKPASPGAETPSMKPCPPRTSLLAPEAVTALNGTWGIKDGDKICPAGGDSVTFDLERPIPTVLRGPFGEPAPLTAWVKTIERDGEVWRVTESSSFDAAIYRFTPGPDSTLVQSTEYDDAKVTLARCP